MICCENLSSKIVFKVEYDFEILHQSNSFGHMTTKSDTELKEIENNRSNCQNYILALKKWIYDTVWTCY